MKRTLFALLTVLLVALLAVSVSAAAVEIGSASQLAALMGSTDDAALAKDYILTQDIDLSGVSNQKPIGSKDHPFTGSFDGDGHTVSGINIKTTTAVSTGLFGHVAGTVTIEDLTASGTISTTGAAANVGVGMVGFAGGVKDSTVTIRNCVNNCDITGKTSSSEPRIGGILGLFSRDSKTNVNLVIENCINHGDITGYKHIGGIVGRIHESTSASSSAGTGAVTVSGCSNFGNIVASADGAGGMIGPILINKSSVTVKNCYNAGSVEASERVGGIVGIAYTYSANASVMIENCVNIGSVKAKNSKAGHGAGGVLGNNGISGDNAKGAVTVKNCFNGGDISASSANAAQAGMLIGEAFGTADYSTGNCYSAEASITAGGNTLVTKKVTNLADASQYPSTLATAFAFTASGPYPKNAPHTCTISMQGDTCACPICGTELLDVQDGYVLLETAEDLLLLMANAENEDAMCLSYKLTANIDLDSVDGQTPIGVVAVPFAGTFDGNGKRIDGIKIQTAGVSAGLFGHVSGATIRNLTVDGTVSATGMITTSASTVGTGIGGIVGGIGAEANKTTVIENCVNYCTLSSTSNPSRIGGIAGVLMRQGKKNIHLVIRDCVNYGDINCKKHAGGILGRQEDQASTASGTTLIENCINYGDITIASGNYDAAAGIFGVSLARNTQTTVKNCINLGDVSGGYRLGGIMGITYNYTENTTHTIESCANLGSVSASYDNATHSAGGIVGTGANSAETANGLTTVRNCFNGGDITAISQRKAQGGMIVGLVVAGCESGIAYLDNDNYYSSTAVLNDGGNTLGGEEIVAAKWCMEEGFTFTDATETARTHLWANDTDDAICIICGVTRHAKHAGAMTHVSEEATCVAPAFSYDLCETCYIRENVAEGTEIDADNHEIAWDVTGDTAVLGCTRCTYTEDLSAVDVLYVSENGDPANDGLTKETAFASYALAQQIAAKMGKDMTICLVGKVTLSNQKVSANFTIAKSFEEHPHAYKLTVTSAEGAKATLCIPNTVTYYHLYGATTFENIKIVGSAKGTSTGGSSVRFLGRGFALTMGEGIEMTDLEGKINFKESNGTFGLSNEINISDSKVYVFGGFQNGGLYEGVTNASMNKDITTNLTVLSGSYYAIVGGNHSTDTNAAPVDFVNANINTTVGDVDVRYLGHFSINNTFSVNGSTANMHIVGKVSAIYIYRVVFSSNDASADNTVNFFFHEGSRGMQVGDYPMASKTAEAKVNAYYALGADTDPVAQALHLKTLYYRTSYPNMGEKLYFPEWCVTHGGRHDFADGACSFCGIDKCNGAKHYIAWDANGEGKCIAGCGHTVKINSYKGIYVSDKGRHGALGTKADPIASYTLAQRLAAKAGKTFTIYLLDTVTVETNVVSDSNTYARCFEEALHTNTIKVTKGGSSKATLVIPYSTRNYFLSGPVSFSNIKISGDNASGMVRFFARGNNLTMDSGIEMVNLSGKPALTEKKTDSGIKGFGATVTIPNSKVYVFGGFLLAKDQEGLQDGGDSLTAYTVDLSIQSGKYWSVSGGNYSDDADNAMPVLDGASIRIGLSAITARYLAPVNLNGKGTINNTTVKMEYKGTAHIALAHRFTYSDLTTGSGNTINHFFHKRMTSMEAGDFGMGSPNVGVAVNCYYATVVDGNEIVTGFMTKHDRYAESYGQTGEFMSFPEWCVERGGGHNFVNGVCSFCEISPCTRHTVETVVLAEPTCSDPGTEADRCTVCFEHIEERDIPIDANAHDAAWVYGDTSATYVCSLCNTPLSTVIYDALAENGEIHLSAAADVNGDGTAEKPVNDFALAMLIAAAADEDVTVYVHDVATITDNGNGASLLDYVEPAHDNRITITSYGDTRAVLRFSVDAFRVMTYNLSGPTTIENIEISAWKNPKAIYIAARHNDLVIGEDVSIDYQRRASNSHTTSIYLVGGCYGTSNPCSDGAGANLTVCSGTYGYIYGGSLNARCNTTGDITLNLFGDITVRQSIIAGNGGNSTYNGNSGDIHIHVDGNVVSSKIFAFSSAGADKNGALYTSGNVTLKIYGGTISTEGFRYGNAEAIRAIGATAAGETATDRIESLAIYVNPADNAAKTMYSFLLDNLRAPVELVVDDDATEEPDEGENDSEDGDVDVGTGNTVKADPAKYAIYWMDDTYCEVNTGAHTQGDLVDHLDASCIAEGYDLYHCTACEKDYAVVIEKLPHIHGDVITMDATCIAPEMEKAVCTVCGTPAYTVVGNAFADHTDPEKTGFCQVCNLDLTANCEHVFGDAEAFTSGCGTGTRRTCESCGKVEVEVFGDGHNFGKYVVTVEPTETTAGIKSRTCKGCGKVETALLYATDAVNASAVATDANGNLADLAVETSKLTKGERAALNALLQQDAYGTEIKISYETEGDVITGITYSIPVPVEYTDYENVRIVVRDDDGTIHFVDFAIEKGYIVFTF